MKTLLHFYDFLVCNGVFVIIMNYHISSHFSMSTLGMNGLIYPEGSARITVLVRNLLLSTVDYSLSCCHGDWLLGSVANDNSPS